MGGLKDVNGTFDHFTSAAISVRRRNELYANFGTLQYPTALTVNAGQFLPYFFKHSSLDLQMAEAPRTLSCMFHFILPRVAGQHGTVGRILLE